MNTQQSRAVKKAASKFPDRNFLPPTSEQRWEGARSERFRLEPVGAPVGAEPMKIRKNFALSLAVGLFMAAVPSQSFAALPQGAKAPTSP
ncbi:hypothetical protein ACFSLT_27965 [Novosphingobium resinovorum]